MPPEDEVPEDEAPAASLSDEEIAALSHNERKKLANGDSREGLKHDLSAERAKRHALEAELSELRKAQMSDTEKAIEDAKASARSEAMGEANIRIIRSEVRAAAARKLNDPADATAMLDLSQFSVNEDGSIDEVAISAAIDTLIEAKPYLAAGAVAPTPGDPDAGSRKPAPQKDLPTQIREAEAAGDYTLATRLKTSQLLSS